MDFGLNVGAVKVVSIVGTARISKPGGQNFARLRALGKGLLLQIMPSIVPAISFDTNHVLKKNVLVKTVLLPVQTLQTRKNATPMARICALAVTNLSTDLSDTIWYSMKMLYQVL